MVLKASSSIQWNRKFLPAHGTWYFISWTVIPVVLFKTLEAEAVKTRQ